MDGYDSSEAWTTIETSQLKAALFALLAAVVPVAVALLTASNGQRIGSPGWAPRWSYLILVVGAAVLVRLPYFLYRAVVPLTMFELDAEGMRYQMGLATMRRFRTGALRWSEIAEIRARNYVKVNPLDSLPSLSLLIYLTSEAKARYGETKARWLLINALLLPISRDELAELLQAYHQRFGGGAAPQGWG